MAGLARDSSSKTFSAASMSAPARGLPARIVNAGHWAAFAGKDELAMPAFVRKHLTILTLVSQNSLPQESLSDVTVADLSSVEFLSNLADALAAGTVELPAFPQVVIKMQAAFKDPSYTPQKIAHVVATERTLADRVLQMANSTAFNATGRVIIDLGVAINRLGAQKVYSIALGHAVAHIRRNESMRPIAAKLDELWSECVTVAHFSEAVAKRCSLTLPGAFAAGLLHGIGRFYILVQSASTATRPQVPLSAALIDAWHPAIAKAVLKNWQMDAAVCEAVGAQAELNSVGVGAATLTDVLIASIRLAARMRNYDNESLNAGGAFARLNLTVEACQGLIAQASEEIRALQRALRP
jgi:HD-like signal output (HDOD) protein